MEFGGKYLMKFAFFFIAGYSHQTVVMQEVDYSKYLGPGYKERQESAAYKKQVKNVPTIVSNHVTNFDWFFLAMAGYIGLPITAAQKGKTPFDPAFDALQAIRVERGESKDAKDLMVEAIMKKQGQIAKLDAPVFKTQIFAEGSVTNGRSMSKFRRGAF